MFIMLLYSLALSLDLLVDRLLQRDVSRGKDFCNLEAV
jgi:hypothetical protein